MGSKEVVIQGCVFTEIHNGTAYELTRYTGNAPRLKIPAFLGDNKPVVRIGDSILFSAKDLNYNNKNIKRCGDLM